MSKPQLQATLAILRVRFGDQPVDEAIRLAGAKIAKPRTRQKWMRRNKRA